MDTDFLRMELADCLRFALSELAMKRPSDPIEYLAHNILKWKNTKVAKNETEDMMKETSPPTFVEESCPQQISGDASVDSMKIEMSDSQISEETILAAVPVDFEDVPLSEDTIQSCLKEENLNLTEEPKHISHCAVISDEAMVKIIEKPELVLNDLHKRAPGNIQSQSGGADHLLGVNLVYETESNIISKLDCKNDSSLRRDRSFKEAAELASEATNQSEVFQNPKSKSMDSSDSHLNFFCDEESKKDIASDFVLTPALDILLEVTESKVNAQSLAMSSPTNLNDILNCPGTDDSFKEVKTKFELQNFEVPEVFNMKENFFMDSENKSIMVTTMNAAYVSTESKLDSQYEEISEVNKNSPLKKETELVSKSSLLLLDKELELKIDAKPTTIKDHSIDLEETNRNCQIERKTSLEGAPVPTLDSGPNVEPYFANCSPLDDSAPSTESLSGKKTKTGLIPQPNDISDVGFFSCEAKTSKLDSPLEGGPESNADPLLEGILAEKPDQNSVAEPHKYFDSEVLKY